MALKALDTFQRIAIDRATELFKELVVKMIAEKFAAKGLRLSRRQMNRLRKAIAADNFSSLQFRDWRFWERDKHIEIEITPDDLAAIDHRVDDVLEAFSVAVPRLLNDAAEHVLKTFVKRWPAQKRRERKRSAPFVTRLNRRWFKPLDGLAMLLTICREFGLSINEKLRTRPDARPATIDVLTRLHARSCQTADEVLTLLRHGFADGAMARWRTMHEIAVTANFILESGELIAERYVAYQLVESRFATRQYKEYEQRLAVQLVDNRAMDDLEQRYQELLTQYGPAFAKQYGWALPRFPDKKDIQFFDLELAVGTDHWRPYYRLAGHNIHANPRGAFYKLGLFDDEKILLAGPSNFGLSDPGQSAAISLTQTTIALGMLDVPTFDTAMMIKVIARLSDQVGEWFVEANRELKRDAAQNKKG